MIARNSIFREYDIRGVVGKDFDAEFAYELGRAFSALVKESFPEAEGQELRVGVGRDCRLSGEELSANLMRGIMDGGVSVLETGMGPTPQLYYAVFSKDLAGGIQVTGSHNPGDQNGFKMMLGKKTLSGAAIQDLKNRLQTTEKASLPGARESVDMRSLYIEDLVCISEPCINTERKLKVVVDAGNGVGGLVGPEVLRRLGCEVIELYTEPDGSFPNHHPDPTVLENLIDMQKRVLEEGADIGIAWDGDADRIGVVDQNGEPVFGDMLLIIYGRQLLREVENPIIIGDVKCSELMFSDLKSRGAKTVIAKTGHSLMKAKLKELNAHLAGEMSGHMFFVHRFYGFDDAIHAAARLVEILTNSNQKMSDLLSDLPKMVATPEIRVDCPDDIKFSVIEKAQQSFSEYPTNTLDGVRITFPNGWGLVRASNTQAVLVMRFEADSKKRLEQYQSLVEERIQRIRTEL